MFRIGRAVTLLVARLVLANIASTLTPRERDLNPAALVRPAKPTDEKKHRAARRSVAELLHVLSVDRGCSPPTTHEACAAATELAEHARDSIAIQKALEETVVIARRAGCVRSAAVDSLAMLDLHVAERALRRMEAITARRVEWERQGDDVELLRRLGSVLAASSAEH